MTTLSSAIRAIFISYNTTDPRKITINGAPKEVPRTLLEGDPVVQLRRARFEESGFDWNQKHAKLGIRKVIVKDVLIYDDMDIKCIEWFILNKIQIDLSETYISPDALDELKRSFNRLIAENIQVLEGSVIWLPSLSGYGRLAEVAAICKKIGFSFPEAKECFLPSV